MTELIPDQRVRVLPKSEPATDAPDIRTSQLPARQATVDGVVRLYPAVCHDTPADDKTVKNRAGKAFGRQFRSEGIGATYDLAHLLLSAAYGVETADAMIARADRGEYVFGGQLRSEGGGYKYRSQIDVCQDKSRGPGHYVLIGASLRQKGKAPVSKVHAAGGDR